MIKKLLLSLSLLFIMSVHSQVVNWNNDISTAITASNRDRKPMLILFTDSNFSKGALNAQILNTLDFALWSRDNVILVKLDLTDDSSNEYLARNLSLKKAFGVQELPEICFSKAGIRKEKITYELIGKTGYKPGGVKSWIAEATEILNRAQY
jgi:protein disulfide-isomerase